MAKNIFTDIKIGVRKDFMINANITLPPVTQQKCNCTCCCCHNPINEVKLTDISNKCNCDTFVSGILPPKDWKPDPYAGLGPELSPEEKLKKKYEDLKKPMYFDNPEVKSEDKPQKKTLKEKVHDFAEKLKEKIKSFSQNILCSVKNVFNKTNKD